MGIVVNLEAGDAIVVATIVLAPLAVLLIVAFIRGYRFDIHMSRNGKKNGNGDGE